MKIREATSRDLDAVENLLSANDLPVDGVKENFSSFVVGRRLVEQVLEQVLEQASDEGIEELFLLTTTAEKYFPRFGFSSTSRSAVPTAIKASAEFQGACPDSAVVMTRRVTSRAKASA